MPLVCLNSQGARVQTLRHEEEMFSLWMPMQRKVFAHGGIVLRKFFSLQQAGSVRQGLCGANLMQSDMMMALAVLVIYSVTGEAFSGSREQRLKGLDRQ